MSSKQANQSAESDELRNWLCVPENFHAPEAILMHRLAFDTGLAAARKGYYLNTYYDDVDHDGFALIFDDQDTLKKIQVKTVDSRSVTGQWEIHKRILRPPSKTLKGSASRAPRKERAWTAASSS